jgi:hypothetical protein
MQWLSVIRLNCLVAGPVLSSPGTAIQQCFNDSTMLIVKLLYYVNNLRGRVAAVPGLHKRSVLHPSFVCYVQYEVNDGRGFENQGVEGSDVLHVGRAST